MAGVLKLPQERHRMALLPHMGLGDMLVLRGMVVELCRVHEGVLVIGLRRYKHTLLALFEDLNARLYDDDDDDDHGGVVLYLVNDAKDISPAYRAGDEPLLALMREGYQVLALGYHAEGAKYKWSKYADTWSKALYTKVGLDPSLMYSLFALPASRRAASEDMLRKVLDITGNKPYILIHDDAERTLQIPPVDDSAVVVLHVNDERFASDVLFDYVDTLRHAAHVHAIDSCFALLMDLAQIDDVPLTIHAYARDPNMYCWAPSSPGDLADRWTILNLKLEYADDERKRQIAIDTIRQLPLPEFDDTVTALVDALSRVNRRLWQLENDVRRLMAAEGPEAQAEFIKAARSVPVLNDTRAHLKQRIDELTGYGVLDCKTYS